MGACALHTVIGRNSRRRKGLEPSRRLSETTGPQSPSAFRIAFRVTGVTKRGARYNRVEVVQILSLDRRYFFGTFISFLVHSSVVLPVVKFIVIFMDTSSVLSSIQKETNA